LLDRASVAAVATHDRRRISACGNRATISAPMASRSRQPRGECFEYDKPGKKRRYHLISNNRSRCTAAGKTRLM